YRVGHYGGAGARLMATSPELDGEERDVPSPDPATGHITCAWPESWRLTVPADWLSGLYVATFTTKDGHRSHTPFVVREPGRGSDLLAVVPVTTYQAYNMWPQDNANGKNLYKGYLPTGEMGSLPERARTVSFERPYSGVGTPSWFELETSFAQWAEEAGYDVTYATSIDLHEGRVDPERYSAMVFTGHDEYWSKPMRDLAERGKKAGTHLAFLAANNIYFHIRLEAGNRRITCYKDVGTDPAPDEAGPTVRWRKVDKRRRAEQKLLGVQYNGMPAEVPLVVTRADHWFWDGTGVGDGTLLDGLVGVEADGVDDKFPKPKGEQTLLSASPYADRLGRGIRTQNTSLVEDKLKTMVFVAGTFHWSRALREEGPVADTVRRATGNLLDRMLAPRE
ncbi:MAG TPA: N,N-dimethylformamidase beta subunit family domain-containing protein, partial [Phytomonospora sp.]